MKVVEVPVPISITMVVQGEELGGNPMETMMSPGAAVRVMMEGSEEIGSWVDWVLTTRGRIPGIGEVDSVGAAVWVVPSVRVGAAVGTPEEVVVKVGIMSVGVVVVGVVHI